MKNPARLSVLCFIIVGLLPTHSKSQNINITYIWSANIPSNSNIIGRRYISKLSPIDLNGDGQKEQIIVTTLIGGSQNGNTLEIRSALGMRKLLNVNFSSAGGCAIGNIISNGKAKQVAIWDYYQDRDQGESHTSPHHHNVTVYKWNPMGNQEMIQSHSYQTKRKYAFVNNSKKPFLEFMQNRNEAIKVSVLEIRNISSSEIGQALGAEWRTYHKKQIISNGKQMGPWLLFYHKKPGLDGEFSLMKKKNGKWVYITGGSSFGNDDEMGQMMGVPTSAWQKLWQAASN